MKISKVMSLKKIKHKKLGEILILEIKSEKDKTCMTDTKLESIGIRISKNTALKLAKALNNLGGKLK